MLIKIKPIISKIIYLKSQPTIQSIRTIVQSFRLTNKALPTSSVHCIKLFSTLNQIFDSYSIDYDIINMTIKLVTDEFLVETNSLQSQVIFFLYF